MEVSGSTMRRVPDPARAVADAVLYEGYLLYPYRKSSGKNRVRWQFGVLAPHAWVAEHGDPEDESIAGSVESWFAVTECLLEAPPETDIHVFLRFLQLQTKSVQQRVVTGEFVEEPSLEVDGTTHTTFDEAVPQEFEFTAPLGSARTFSVSASAAEQVEALGANARIVRQRRPVDARVTVTAETAEAPFRLHRVRIRVENTVTDADLSSRERMLRRAMIATHTFVNTSGGAFLSLLEYPQWAEPAVRNCHNVHTFPVLAAEPPRRDLMLSSPIILYDYPRVAPESPGDLFDAAEIDEILTLRTLTLSDAEKQEARATDRRAAAIIDRAGDMPPELFARLHGAVRSLRPVRDPAPEWWQPGADDDIDPETDSVLVAGVGISRGSRVRLHPRPRGTDAHDMFLEGRIGRVHAVLTDVDGSRQVAVSVEDDPGADLHGWYGRFRHFSPEEIEPMPAEESGPR